MLSDDHTECRKGKEGNNPVVLVHVDEIDDEKVKKDIRLVVVVVL